jgi:phospholipid/cholesterol/gamma-HCH transport system substrate-binding protein
MRSRWNLPVFAGYAAVSFLVLVLLAAQMGGEFLFQPVYQVRALFASGAQLVPGDDVTINGFRVGRVTALEPVSQGAKAVLELHSQYSPLYQDARAMVKSKNLLGETYVELNRGTTQSGPLADGGQIGLDHTLTPVEISRVLDVLDPSTQQRLVLLINNLGESVQGRGQDLNVSASDLRGVAQSLETIAHAVASQQGNLDVLLSTLRKVLDTLAAYHSQIRALIGDWDRLMRTLASRESNLQGLFVQEDRVVTILDQALAGGNAQGLHNALAEAPGLLDNTNHYLDNAQPIFSDLDTDVPSITALFDRLASVMSGTDPQGDHMWRIYAVVNAGTVALPCGSSGNPCAGPAPVVPNPAGGGR